jgi:hypothetical protein
LLDGLIAGETEDGGWTAGDFAGRDVAGGVDPDGEIVGVCEGGDKVGDFAGDVLETTGDCTGGIETEDGGFTGGCETDDLGEEAGALSPRTKIKVVKNIESTKSEKNLFIFEVFWRFGKYEEKWNNVCRKICSNNVGNQSGRVCVVVKCWSVGDGNL